MALGTCETAPPAQDCGQKTTNTACESIENPGCYWDAKETESKKCKACYSYGQKTIISCSNYSSLGSCNNDRCQLGLGGADALLLMGQKKMLNGEEYEVTKTNCTWNAASQVCTLDTTWTPVQSNGNGNQQNPPNMQCTYSTVISGCGSCNAGIFQGKLVNYTLVSGNHADCTESSESCARCGFTQERLPFFSAWQIIPFIFLIAIYYFVILKKRK
jgi:hypothetical protein